MSRDIDNAIFFPTLADGCTLPVPSGYTQSQIHPSIVIIEGGWQGYTHWMASTPWFNNSEENPCVYKANYNGDGTHPKVFTPIANNPVEPQPPYDGDIYNYNADCELYFKQSDNGGLGRMYMLYKQGGAYSETGHTTVIRAKYSDDGETWLENEAVILDSKPSPSIIERNGKYWVYTFDSNANAINYPGAGFKGLVIHETTDLVNGTYTQIHYGNMWYRDWEAWHFDVFEYDGKLYMIWHGYRPQVSSQGNIYLAVSDDYINFKTFKRPIIASALTSCYRPSALVDVNGNFVMYNAVRGDYWNDGVLSEDGKVVVLNTMPMADLLFELTKDNLESI